MRLNFCAACGRSDSLEHHHFIPRASGGSDDETNTLTLCGACHMIMHELRSGQRLNLREMIKAGLQRARAEGKDPGRRGYDDTNPALVREAKRLARKSPKTGNARSLREIAAALADAGHVTSTGKPFSAGQVKRLLGYRLASTAA